MAVSGTSKQTNQTYEEFLIERAVRATSPEAFQELLRPLKTETDEKPLVSCLPTPRESDSSDFEDMPRFSLPVSINTRVTKRISQPVRPAPIAEANQTPIPMLNVHRKPMSPAYFFSERQKPPVVQLQAPQVCHPVLLTERRTKPVMPMNFGTVRSASPERSRLRVMRHSVRVRAQF